MENSINIGIIGLGEVGTLLVKLFSNSEKLSNDNILVYNRTKEKAAAVKEKYSNVEVCNTIKDLSQKSDMVFLCINGNGVNGVTSEINAYRKEGQTLVSGMSNYDADVLSEFYNGSIIRCIPTMLQHKGHGITLVYYHNLTKREEADFEERFDESLTLREIKEESFTYGTEITSCAPGIYAALFKFYEERIAEMNIFGREELKGVLLDSLKGFVKLLEDDDFETIVKKVATPGGITGAAVEVLEKDLPALYDNMFANTKNRHEVRIKNNRNIALTKAV